MRSPSSKISRISLYLLLCLALIIIFIPLPVQASQPSEHNFHIEASRFGYQPGTVKVKPGDLVTIELAAQDVMHGLTIDGYDFDLQVEPGRPAKVTFIAGDTGVFSMRCSVTCGNMHPFMVGKFQVGTNTLFLRASALVGLLVVGVLVWRKT